MWSTISILYLFFANRTARTSYRDLKRNSRKTRIILSILTLVFWIVAIACSVLLVIEFGIFALTAGPQTKIALTATRQIILEALEQALTSFDVIEHSLNIVSSIMTVGFMAIVLLVSSITCAKVALVGCIVACCVSGKARQQNGTEELSQLEKRGANVVVTSV